MGNSSVSDTERREALARMMERLHQTSSFAAWVAPWEQWSQDVLTQAQLPPYDVDVRIHADGSWTADLPENWLSRVEEITRLGAGVGRARDIAELRYGIDSPEWVAADILQRLALVRILHARGALDSVQNLTAGLVRAIAQFSSKIPWKVFGHRGGNQRARLQRDPVQRRHAQWQTEADMVWKRNPALSCMAVARRVAQRCGGSPYTIRKIIRKPTS